jgi:inward rectifier potassium channel
VIPKNDRLWAASEFDMAFRRQQRISMAGYQAIKTGMPSTLGDLYYEMMEMSWPAFIGVVTVAFLLLNLLFGSFYALLPGAIANMTPGSIWDGFFFSVETLGTVGYGNLAPVSRLGHAIDAIEILVGLFFSATMTGLIFARFAKPRNSLLFSKVAVVGTFDGKPALMVRLASTRSAPLADATAQMAWLERTPLETGRSVRRLVDLPLVRSHNAMLGLAWTLIHVLEEGSLFLAMLRGERPFNLMVSVSGTDTLLASQSIGGITYGRDDVLLDHEYVDVISEIDGMIHLDLRNFHRAVPTTTPTHA